MPFSLIQVAIVAFAALMLVGAALRFRRGEMRRGPAALWAALWIGVIVFVASPDLSQDVAVTLGVGRGVDVIVYLSILALLFMQYRLWARQERIDRALTAISRAIALSGLDGRETPPAEGGDSGSPREG